MDFNLIAQFSFFNPSTLWAILQMVIGLGFVIFVHELGHFLVAKACGVKCEKFYLGFDAFDIKIGDRVLIPRRLVHWKWGETEYGVGILPLGGYVKMLGQDDNPAQISEERKRAEQDGKVEDETPELDPRSYQAKTVPQRMAIISAGVIMNLIFAVIFASIAFGTGVIYEPPQVGTTISGSPAWQSKLDGATVVGIGEESTRNRYYTFGHLREAIVFDGQAAPIELTILELPQAEDIKADPLDNSTLKPVSLSVATATNLINVKGAESLPALGIGPASSAVLSSSNPTLEGQAAHRADPPLEPGDKIVSVDGKSIVRNMTDENGNPYRQHNVFLLKMLLAQNTDKDIEMVVERTDPKTKEVSLVTSKIPKNPMRTIGLTMELGEVDAIQINSAASEAGIKPGDLITKIDGLAVGDPFTLESRMVAKARKGESVLLTVKRSSEGTTEGGELELRLKPRMPRVPNNVDENRPLGINTMGIAVFVKNVVRGSSDIGGQQVAAITPGTTITKVQFMLSKEQQAIFGANAAQPVDLTKKKFNWPLINLTIQQLPAGTEVELTCESDGGSKIVVATVQEYPGHFNVARGIRLSREQMTYQSKSVWEAVQLGYSQTWADATKVVKFLGKLIRGDIPITGLGGPGTIVMAATSEASQGTSRLLLFLTLLSANLAVINFLPIPILDGGHMVFLAYEGIFRRPVSERLQIVLSFGGLIFIVGLMLLVISLDVWRWSGLF